MSEEKKNNRIIGAIILCISLLASAAFAGIPEPGIILYGQVRDATGALVTNGELTWTLTDGVNPVTVTTQLRQIDGQGGPFSYSVLIPLETAVTGHPASTNTIPITSSPVSHTRTAQITGTTLSRTDNVSISYNDRGTAVRISIGFTDDDNDGLPDDWEQQIIDADPNDNITSIWDVLPGDDFDGDGKTNSEEYKNGTDPIVWNGAGKYQLNTSVSPQSSGSVSPDCSVGCLRDTGVTVTLTATENTGYIFSHWTGCDSPSGNVCTLTMDSNKNVIANFVTVLSITNAQTFTEVIANDPGSLVDGWYLHMRADVEDPLGVPGNIQAVTAVNLDVNIDDVSYVLDHYSGQMYDTHPDYLTHSGTYKFTATNNQGKSVELDAAPIDNPVQLGIIQNIVVSDNSAMPIISFDTVAGADQYRLTIFHSSDLGTSIYESELSDTPSFSMTAGVMKMGNTYYLRAEALDINTTDSDGIDDIENRSLNYLEFAVHSQVTGIRSLPSYAAKDSDINVSIAIDVDETSVPDGLIVNEFIPSEWVLVSATPNNSSYDQGTGKVGWLFLDIGVLDTTISYTVHIPGTEVDGAIRNISGELKYNDPIGDPLIVQIGGDQQVEIGNVYHLYDTNQDWEIGDFELLDAIDEWAAGNLGDFDLLDLIDFWAVGCYHWDAGADKYMMGCL